MQEQRSSMDTETIQRIRKASCAVFRDTSVFVAYAHGSRVSGTARGDSDLDIGYYTEHNRPLPIADEMLLEHKFAEELGLEVDLRNLGAAPLVARGRALEQGVRVYCSNESTRVDAEVALLARYHDRKRELTAMSELRRRSRAGELV